VAGGSINNNGGGIKKGGGGIKNQVRWPEVASKKAEVASRIL
jgi:hypothetical protein